MHRSLTRAGWFRLDRHDDPPAADPNAGGDPAPGADPAAESALGDAGKRALQAERAAKAAAERAAADAKARADAAEAKVREFEDAGRSELEKAQNAAADAAKRAEAATARAVSAEVRALASEFADPADAAAFLDLSQYADADGQIDSAKITADLAALLDSKPHLRKQADGSGPRTPRPDPGQGPRGGATGAVDFRKASSDEVAAELSKYGIRSYR
jgi:hypothetical protein